MKTIHDLKSKEASLKIEPRSFEIKASKTRFHADTRTWHVHETKERAPDNERQYETRLDRATQSK